MWKRWIVFGVVLAGGAWAAELPPELQHLPALAGDEKALTQAIRDVDKAQTALARQAMEQARDSSETTPPPLLAAARGPLMLVRQAYEFGLSHFTGNPSLHNYYGEFLYDWAGEREAALREWNTALSVDANCSNAHNNLGLHLVHNGDYRLGLKHLDEALRLEPKNPDYLYNIAQVYLVHWPQVQEIRDWTPKKIYRHAMKCSRKAAELAPEDYELVVDYAVNFFAGERFKVKVPWKRAAKAWAAARKQAGDEIAVFYTWLNEGRVWMEARNEKNAARCLREALKLRPDSEPAKQLLERVESGELKQKSKKNTG